MDLATPRRFLILSAAPLLIALLFALPLLASSALLCSELGKAVTFSCNESLSTVLAKGAACVTASKSNATFCVGYQQLSNNKDPIFARYPIAKSYNVENYEEM